MMGSLRGRLCAALAVLTAFIPEWIERLFDVPRERGPDAGSGELEWGIVLLLAAGSLASGWWARRSWLRWARARASGPAGADEIPPVMSR